MMGWPTVYAVCSRCRHYSIAPIQKIVAAMGKSALVSDVEKRLRCKRCGARACRLSWDHPSVEESSCPRCGFRLVSARRRP